MRPLFRLRLIWPLTFAIEILDIVKLGLWPIRVRKKTPLDDFANNWSMVMSDQFPKNWPVRTTASSTPKITNVSFIFLYEMFALPPSEFTFVCAFYSLI